MSVAQTRWKIRITDEAAKIFEGSTLSLEDKLVIQKWAELVRDRGPDALQLRPDVWNDHELVRGQWKGHRASNFSHSGRIIYKVDGNIVSVTVKRIAESHDYR